MKAWWWGLGCVLLFCGALKAQEVTAIQNENGFLLTWPDGYTKCFIGHLVVKKKPKSEVAQLKDEISKLRSRVDSLEKNAVMWNKISTPDLNAKRIHDFLYLIPDDLPLDTVKYE